MGHASVPLTEQSRVVASKNQVSCDLGGEAAILNLGNGVCYGTNAVGTRVWNLVQELRTFGELRDTLLREYDVEAAQLDADLRVLLIQLADQGLVEIAP